MKVKGIELFKMIADGKVNQHTRVSVDNYNDCSLDFVFEDGRNIFKWLDEYFEILEDKTEEIEELNKITKEEFERLDKRTLLELIVKNQNKIIDKLNKQDTSKETNCMTD